MCGFNSCSHDISVCYYERTMVNFNKTQTVRIVLFHHIKKEVDAIFTDIADLDNEQKFTSAS